MSKNSVPKIKHPKPEYEGKVLHKRWQVTGNDGSFNIYDYDKKEFVRDTSGMAKYFTTVKAAETHVAKLSGKALAKTERRKVKIDVNKTYKSAASMFRDLIANSKLDDDSIFASVQQAFGLDDSRRSYVNWYRKDLIKKGLL